MKIPPEKYDVLREERVERRIQEYLGKISGTPKLALFMNDIQRANLRLKFRPSRWGERKYRRRGENGLVGIVFVAGRSLFWIRYIVYDQIKTVLIADFGGR